MMSNDLTCYFLNPLNANLKVVLVSWRRGGSSSTEKAATDIVFNHAALLCALGIHGWKMPECLLTMAVLACFWILFGVSWDRLVKVLGSDFVICNMSVSTGCCGWLEYISLNTPLRCILISHKQLEVYFLHSRSSCDERPRTRSRKRGGK